MNEAEIKYSDIKDEKVKEFMNKIMPYIKADNSLQNFIFITFI